MQYRPKAPPKDDVKDRRPLYGVGHGYAYVDVDGGYVSERPVTPADLTATVLHHLGVDFRQEYEDGFQRLRHRLSEGSPVKDLG